MFTTEIIFKIFLQVILPFCSGAVACLLNYLHVVKEDFTGFSRVKREDGKTYYNLGYWKAVLTGGFVGIVGVHFVLPEGSFTFSKVLITSAFTGISGIGFLVQNAISKHKETARTNEAKAKSLEEINLALLESPSVGEENQENENR